MFERIVSYFLRKYLGWLVKGLDADKLNLSIWGGEVVLNNLELQEMHWTFCNCRYMLRMDA